MIREIATLSMPRVNMKLDDTMVLLFPPTSQQRLR